MTEHLTTEQKAQLEQYAKAKNTVHQAIESMSVSSWLSALNAELHDINFRIAEAAWGKDQIAQETFERETDELQARKTELEATIAAALGVKVGGSNNV
jgi:predicted  nucleic acid-binding Zn-ribbon protein